MANTPDLQKLAEPEIGYPLDGTTLLKKYDIPVNHLDFEYVATCSNGRELEKILHVLKSGEEGFFPQLIDATEKRLAEIKPNSKHLRKMTPVMTKSSLSIEERNNLDEDLESWLIQVEESDKELESSKKFSLRKDMPDVRAKREMETREERKNREKRIQSTDYESWDKYDPDTEILKIDLEEEKMKKEAAKKDANKTKTKVVTINEFSTKAEAEFEADREKEKGNEFFRAKDYGPAIVHYTNCVKYRPSAIGFTNRAIAYIKMKKFKEAVQDCYSALKYEPENVKAQLRAAIAFEGLGDYSKALEHAEEAVELDPNNIIIQEMINRLEARMGRTAKDKTRMKIVDIQDAEIGTNKQNLKDNIVRSGIQRSGTDLNSANEIGEMNLKICQVEKVDGRADICSEIDTISRDYCWEMEKDVCDVDVEYKIGKSGELDDERMEGRRNLLTAIKPKKSILKKTEATQPTLIPIPGPSTMPPPYFILVMGQDPQDVMLAQKEINSRRGVLCMPVIDVGSDDEFPQDVSSDGRRRAAKNNGKFGKKKGQKGRPAQWKSLKGRDKSGCKHRIDEEQSENKKVTLDKNDAAWLLENKVEKVQKVVEKNVCSQNGVYHPTIRNGRMGENERNKIGRSHVFREKTCSPDQNGGGEPFLQELPPDISIDEDLHNPYTFYKTWNSVSRDATFTQQAEILRSLDMSRIVNVIGYKLDSKMLSGIVNCLYRHFAVASEVEKVHSVLINLINVPRFNIVAMFMSKADRVCAQNLIEFLDQHDRRLPEEIRKVYFQ